MPNWTDVTLECEGLSDLPIFTTDENGNKELDYNKIVPMPDYVRDTISPMRTNAYMCFLYTEFPKDQADSILNMSGIKTELDYINMSAEEIIAQTNEPEFLGFGEGAKEISAYDLGKNYYTSAMEEGAWDWYDWAYENWGVKWNASDSFLDGDRLSFMAPWGYPDKIFEKLADMFPDKNFYAEIIYEDEYDTIHTLDFSANHWDEDEKVNPGYLEELADEMEFRLGLYNQTNIMYPQEMEESKVFGIAIQAVRDDEPYGTLTTNLMSRMGDFCEMISIKNSAYVDLNNNPWATVLLDKGFAKDTGYTRNSGFCEYPLWQFDEDWLKSLKPVVSERTYSDYENKYNEAMGIEPEEEIKGDEPMSNVDKLKEQFAEGKRVKLVEMDGEDPSRMYNGLEGTVKYVDDIGQIHVSWDNGSSLALNPEFDTFFTIEEPELDVSIRPMKENEIDYSYSQERKILERSGCIGHLRVDMDTTGHGFYTDWTDHVHELNDSKFKRKFDEVINYLREDGNLLSDRKTMAEYCSENSEAHFGNPDSTVYGFRVDADEYTCMLRLDTSPGNYAAYVYAYEKDRLDAHLEEMANREMINVVMVEPGKGAYDKIIYSDLESLQDEVGGYIECIYPWADDAGIICNEEGKLIGLPLNRAMRDEEENIYDIIAGPMIIVGLTEDSFCSLTPEQMIKYTEMYKEPETIIRYEGKLKAFPSSDYTQVPVYYQNAEYAKANFEQEVYRASFKANMACKKAIEESTANHYHNNCLDSDKVVSEVTERFGAERVAMILANTCLQESWDKRIDKANIEWAKNVPIPDGKDPYGSDNNRYLVCEKPHIGLIDMVASKVRNLSQQAEKKKESVLEKMEEKKKVVKPAKSKTAKNKEISLDG